MTTEAPPQAAPKSPLIRVGTWHFNHLSVPVWHDMATGCIVARESGRAIAESKGCFALYTSAVPGALGKHVGFSDLLGATRWLKGMNLENISRLELTWFEGDSPATTGTPA